MGWEWDGKGWGLGHFSQNLLDQLKTALMFDIRFIALKSDSSILVNGSETGCEK